MMHRCVSRRFQWFQRFTKPAKHAELMHQWQQRRPSCNRQHLQRGLMRDSMVARFLCFKVLNKLSCRQRQVCLRQCFTNITASILSRYTHGSRAEDIKACMHVKAAVSKQNIPCTPSCRSRGITQKAAVSVNHVYMLNVTFSLSLFACLLRTSASKSFSGLCCKSGHMRAVQCPPSTSDKQTNKQTNRQTDRQTYRQTDRTELRTLTDPVRT